MQIGDKVRKHISTSVAAVHPGVRYPEEQAEYTGVVVYAHPRGRYYTAEFTFPQGKIRETYREVE